LTFCKSVQLMAEAAFGMLVYTFCSSGETYNYEWFQ
jgi:hypothetical protein